MDPSNVNGNTGHSRPPEAYSDTEGTGDTGVEGLSSAHCLMLLEKSGIAQEIVEERGYRTVRRRAELKEFPNWQRRLGLYVPTYSPDGETVRCQLRPDKRRKDGPKYETPQDGGYILDCHPSMMDAVRDPDRGLWITEGCKKVDSLATRGEPCIGLVGVHMFAVAKTEGKVPLECWKHVPLRGRLVRVVFDSDCMEKEGVQLALSRLVAMLEGLGADVRVVYLPSCKGEEKVGVDDYLASGGTVAELKALARRFEPQDLGRIRLSRDERLRAAVEDLERTFWNHEWKGMGGHSARDVFKVLIDEAVRSGKPHADGVRVKKAWGSLEVEAKVSRRTLSKAITRLEDAGLVYRDNEGREEGKAGAFVLRATVNHKGEREVEGEKVSGSSREGDPSGIHLRAPRLRWSRPKWKPTKKTIREHRLGARSWLPEPRTRIERLGKTRGAILDALDDAGGTATIRELAETLHKKRARDVRRRLLPALEKSGIIEVDGDSVHLAGDWLEKLDAARQVGGEIGYEYTLKYVVTVGGVDEVRRKKIRRAGADELAEERRKLKSRAFHNRNKAPESRPSAAGLEAVRRSHAIRDARLQEIARAEEERRQAGPPSALEALISRTVSQLDRLRLGLLCEVAMDAGFNWRDVPEAVRRMGYRSTRLPEYGDAEFVFPPPETVEGAVPDQLENTGNRQEPPGPVREEWLDHALDCTCDSCTMPLPRYARGVGAA